MSLHRVVKLLYSLTFSILYFIIWNFAAFIFMQLMPDTRIFVLEFLMVCLMQFLSTKYSKKILIFLPSCVLGISTLIVIYGASHYLANIIYLIINLFILAKEDENSIEYNNYRKKIIIGIYSLVAMGIMLLAVNVEIRTYLLRFYILFLVSSIILLRESRRLRYSVQGKKTILANIIVMISVVILSSDKIFRLVVLVFRSLWWGISYIADIILMILVRLLIPFMNYVEYQIQRINKLRGDKSIQMESGKSFKDIMGIQENVQDIPQWMVLGVKIIILLAAAYIAYRLYKSYRYRGMNDFEGVTEKREKIRKTSAKERQSMMTVFKKIFSERDIRAQILKVYESFEKKTYEKNIFKRHMTATQLYNVSKTYIYNLKALKNITDTYNKTKFSQHNPSASELKSIKENYRNLKEQIDNVKN